MSTRSIPMRVLPICLTRPKRKWRCCMVCSKPWVELHLVSLSLSSSCAATGADACEMFRPVLLECEMDSPASCEIFRSSSPSKRDVVDGVVCEPCELPSPRLFLRILLSLLPREVDIVYVCLSRAFSFPFLVPAFTFVPCEHDRRTLLASLCGTTSLETVDCPDCRPVCEGGVMISLYWVSYRF